MKCKKNIFADPSMCFRCHHKWNHTGREAKKLPYIDYGQTNKQANKQKHTPNKKQQTTNDK